MGGEEEEREKASGGPSTADSASKPASELRGSGSRRDEYENEKVASKLRASEPDDGGGDGDDDTRFPDPNYEDPTALESASWWAEFTSVHGVYYMLERGHLAPWKKTIWAVIVLVATGGMIWGLVEEFQAFFEYDVDTSTRTVIPSSLPFPQVTVCNTNMYSSVLQNETGIVEPRNEEELNSISQPAEEFIRSTLFNGVAPTETPSDAWTPVITPFGRCYEFATDEEVFMPGGSGGLEVWTWLNQSTYEDDTLLAGIQVFVAQRGSPVTLQSPGVLVPPGAASLVQTKLRRFRRETDEPWKSCFGKAPEHSNQRCREECVNAATRDKCGCRPIGDDVDPGLRYCNSSDVGCASTVSGDDVEQCELCSIPPCEEDIYVLSYSAARVALKAADRLDTLLELPPGEVLTNLVQVYVNYETIRYEETTETKSTSAAQLLSNLGGIFGFFMGISMISIVEIFGELLCLRLLPRLWGDKRLYGIGQKD